MCVWKCVSDGPGPHGSGGGGELRFGWPRAPRRRRWPIVVRCVMNAGVRGRLSAADSISMGSVEYPFSILPG